MSAPKTENTACQRKSGRRRTLFGGVVFFGDNEEECFVSDISASGAKVRLKNPVELGTDVDLKINKFDFLLKARVVWLNGAYTGLEFKTPLNPKDRHLARLFSLVRQ